MTSLHGDRTPGSAAPSVDLRPLTTSELIDRGFTLYRQNFAGLFLVALLSQIAPLAASQGLLTAIKIVPAQGELMERPATDVPRLAVLLGLWILGQIINFGFGVIMTSYISDAYLGRIPSLKKSFGMFKGLVGHSVLTCLLNIVLLTVVMILPIVVLAAYYLFVLFHPATEFAFLLLYIVCAVLLLVASFAPTLIVFMWLRLAVPAVALENLSGWAAVKRSTALVRYNPNLGILYWGAMRLSFLLLPLFVIQLLALGLTFLPEMLHEINEGFMHGSVNQASAMPESAKIVSQVLVLLSTALILPLYLIASTLFYFDVRIRREGFDLEYMAAQVKAAS